MHCLMMNCSMMLCHVVAVFLFAGGPVVSKLSLTFSVMKPMVFHVHCFQFFDNVVVDNTECSGVVRLHWGRRLGIAHEFKGVAARDGFSAVDVESPHLSLSRQGHDRLDNLCNCEDGAIVLLDMKKCPPAQLHAFDLERYDALLCPARSMSLARYMRIALG